MRFLAKIGSRPPTSTLLILPPQSRSAWATKLQSVHQLSLADLTALTKVAETNAIRSSRAAVSAKLDHFRS